ncbi:MAG TPA: hypothetical protein VGH28_06705 [Polyangiaceae bacterium]|jgi:hypothetical protein
MKRGAVAAVLLACGGAVAHAPSAPSIELFKPPPDTHVLDAALAPATVDVALLDATGAPAPNESVFLAQISDHPAPDVMGVSDARGHVTLAAPSWAGGQARAVCRKDGAIFFTEPFAIPAHGGVRVTLHAYASSRKMDDAAVIFEMNTLVEPHAPGVSVTVGLRVYDYSRVAWKPDLALPLPAGATHFEGGVTSPATSLDVDAKDGVAHLAGTIAPGMHTIEMRFDLPAGSFRLTPPHLVRARVVTWAGPATRLEVAGFDAPAVDRTRFGAPALLTMREAAPGAVIGPLDITATGLVDKQP